MDDQLDELDEPPTAADVEMVTTAGPAWRRIGPRGILALVAAVIFIGAAGLQAADAWRGPGSRFCRRIDANSAPEAIARCTRAQTASSSSTVNTAPRPATAAPVPARAATTVTPSSLVKAPPPTLSSGATTSRATATTAAPSTPTSGDGAAATATTTKARTTLTNPVPEVVGKPATATPSNTTTDGMGSMDPGSMGPGSTDTGSNGSNGSTGTTTVAGAGLGSNPISANASINAPVGAMASNGMVSAPASVFDPLRNNQAQFNTFANVPANQLDVNALTIPAGRPDNGPQNGEGQFRIACQYSHFSYDDPIVYPGQPGQSHLHMFFGNTNTNANSTTESLVNSGGGTCDGFELNRTAYWTPALLDGNDTAIVPKEIIVYYKSKYPAETVAMPQGLKLVAGNPKAETFTPGADLHWSCGGSDSEYNVTNRIPDCGGDTIKAVIEFPNCWDGKNLDSPDHRSHVTTSNDAPCPAQYPVRFPQISILLYYAGTSSVNGWHLSSDNFKGFNSGPGATLHADWFGGWNNTVMDMWTKGCINAVRDCSYGQTGTDRQLAPINETQTYTGPTQLSLPAGSYQMG